MPLLTGPRESQTGPIKIALLPSPIERIRIGPGRARPDPSMAGRPELIRADPIREEDRIRIGRLEDSRFGLTEKCAPRERREETTAPLKRGPDITERAAADRLQEARQNRAVLLIRRAVLLGRGSRPVREPIGPAAVLLRPDQVNPSSDHLFHGQEPPPPGL